MTGKWKNILIDMDGTILDPKLGITNSVIYALESLGIYGSDPDEIEKYIGPPVWGLFKDVYGFDDERARAALEKYAERFSEKGVYENTVYDGIPQLLDRLCRSGARVMLASSKPTEFAEKILELFGLGSYFSFVGGSELDGSRSAKDEVIAHVLAGAGITELADTVMVGDKRHDMLAAKKLGIASVGVLYGYGDREELEAAGAGIIVDDVRGLEAVLLKKN